MGKPSTNPTLITKADRYVREGRITILTHTPNTITTRIQGTNTYYVWGDNHGYTCTCPAGQTHHTCSHIIATEAIAQQTCK